MAACGRCGFRIARGRCLQAAFPNCAALQSRRANEFVACISRISSGAKALHFRGVSNISSDHIGVIQPVLLLFYSLSGRALSLSRIVPVWPALAFLNCDDERSDFRPVSSARQAANSCFGHAVSEGTIFSDQFSDPDFYSLFCGCTGGRQADVWRQ